MGKVLFTQRRIADHAGTACNVVHKDLYRKVEVIVPIEGYEEDKKDVVIDILQKWAAKHGARNVKVWLLPDGSGVHNVNVDIAWKNRFSMYAYINMTGDESLFDKVVRDDDPGLYKNHTPRKVRGEDACPKCGGRGIIHAFKHVEGGVCYLCKGTGRKPW